MNRWSRHSVLTDLTQRSAIALARGDLKGVRAWAIPRTHPPIEAGAITAVAVMNEKTWRLAVPTAAFNNLLCRPLGGRMRVTPTWSTFSVLNVMVWTQKKSHAHTVDAYCLRNDRQREDGPRRWV
jgi:hypothetical protein